MEEATVGAILTGSDGGVLGLSNSSPAGGVRSALLVAGRWCLVGRSSDCITGRYGFRTFCQVLSILFILFKSTLVESYRILRFDSDYSNRLGFELDWFESNMGINYVRWQSESFGLGSATKLDSCLGVNFLRSQLARFARWLTLQ